MIFIFKRSWKSQYNIDRLGMRFCKYKSQRILCKTYEEIINTRFIRSSLEQVLILKIKTDY